MIRVIQVMKVKQVMQVMHLMHVKVMQVRRMTKKYLLHKIMCRMRVYIYLIQDK